METKPNFLHLTSYLFVYGTLQSGHGNNDVLEKHSSMYLGPAYTKPDYKLINLGHFPGLIEGKYVVHGELYKISSAVLSACDWLEGHPDFYKRELIDVFVQSKNPSDIYEVNKVWAYIYQNSRGDDLSLDSHLSGGRWPPAVREAS